MSSPVRTGLRGFTLRAVLVSVLLMLIMACMLQFAGVIESWGLWLGTEPLPVPAMIVFALLTLVCGAVYAGTRFRVLTRAELLVVLAAVLLSGPLMVHAFWRYMLALPAGIVRKAAFEYYDFYPPSLWPHGPNVVRSICGDAPLETLQVRGHVERRHTAGVRGGMCAELVFSNAAPQSSSSITIRLPVGTRHATAVQPHAPYLLTLLARPEHCDGSTYYYCRVYPEDDPEAARDVLISRKAGKRTFAQPDGFVRVGSYGVRIVESVCTTLVMEVGLQGRGMLRLRALELMDVIAMEEAYAGRRIISADDYDALPHHARGGLIVRPRAWWHPGMLRYLAAGYFPVRAWLGPMARWSCLIVLVLAGSFALAALMRRQWLQHERYPLPMAHVPLGLLGSEHEGHAALPALWRNRMMWAGFALALLWCLLRAWRMYNAHVPNVNISFALKPYLEGPAWGRTWDGVTFSVRALVFGLALFMELNVLMSIVAGYMLFRLQYWVGHVYGAATDAQYPYPAHQMLGSYLMYALMTVVLTRKYLWRVLCQAVRGGNESGEVLSPRAAVLTLLLTCAGIAAWAWWIGISAWVMLAHHVFVLVFCFVAMKLRAECGTPHRPFFPLEMVLVIPLLGGVSVLGGSSALVIILASVLIFSFCFLYLPGMQLELIEMSRRVHLQQRHIIYACVLGVAGGIIIGGWVYLSSMYAVGAQQFPVMTADFVGKGDLKVLGAALAGAAEHAPATSAAAARQWYACAFSGVLTMIVALLRQVFAGFWFHPMGVLVGPSVLAAESWGSVALAALLRYTVMKLGGAVTVRTKLLPFASGIVLGTLAAYLVFAIAKYLLYYFAPSDLRLYMQF